MPVVCVVFLTSRKKQGDRGILTVVVGNNWVILLIMSTLPWPILACNLILNHQLHLTQQNMVWPLQESYVPLSNWSYLVQLTWQHLLLHNCSTKNNITHPHKSQTQEKIACFTQIWMKLKSSDDKNILTFKIRKPLLIFRKYDSCLPLDKRKDCWRWWLTISVLKLSKYNPVRLQCVYKLTCAVSSYLRGSLCTQQWGVWLPSPPSMASCINFLVSDTYSRHLLVHIAVLFVALKSWMHLTPLLEDDPLCFCCICFRVCLTLAWQCTWTNTNKPSIFCTSVQLTISSLSQNFCWSKFWQLFRKKQKNFLFKRRLFPY